MKWRQNRVQKRRGTDSIPLLYGAVKSSKSMNGWKLVDAEQNLSDETWADSWIRERILFECKRKIERDKEREREREREREKERERERERQRKVWRSQGFTRLSIYGSCRKVNWIHTTLVPQVLDLIKNTYSDNENPNSWSLFSYYFAHDYPPLFCSFFSAQQHVQPYTICTIIRTSTRTQSGVEKSISQFLNLSISFPKSNLITNSSYDLQSLRSFVLYLRWTMYKID